MRVNLESLEDPSTDQCPFVTVPSLCDAVLELSQTELRSQCLVPEGAVASDDEQPSPFSGETASHGITFTVLPLLDDLAPPLSSLPYTEANCE